MFNKFQKTRKRFSKHFWLLMIASFVDMLGGIVWTLWALTANVS